MADSRAGKNERGRERRKGRKGRKDEKRRSKHVASLASKADKYRMYEEAVQDPESDVKLARRIFKGHFARKPSALREDFCGTAAFACEWVARHPGARAIGIDLDPEPLQYCREHHLAKLSEEQRARVELVEADVLAPREDSCDIIAAFNFSYFTFKTRKQLLEYLRAAYEALPEEGLLMLDAYGGSDAMKELAETREYDDFDYVWDQHSFDPIQHRAVNYIHFEFEDGSEIRRCFEYDWRLWTLPELRDALCDAGFALAEVYWEGTDRETNEGNGVFRKAEQAPDDPAWIAYVVGVKRSA